MVAIPRSQGVLAQPTTQPSQVAPSIAQSQIIPNAIQGLGNDIAQIGSQIMQQEAKQQDEYEAMQFFDYRNKLRSFDNENKLALQEMPADAKIINTAREKIAERRKVYEQELASQYGDNRRLKQLFKKEAETSFVDLDYSVGQELLRKKKTYDQNTLYESITALKDRYETASNTNDFLQVKNDLKEVLQFGVSNNIITAKEIDAQQEAFARIRKAREDELQKDAIFSQVLTGDIKLDPTNPSTNGIINDNYDRLVEKGYDAKTIGNQLAIQTGVVPDSYKSVLKASVFNGTDNQKLESALTISEFLKNPNLQNQFSESESALALAISSRYSQGLPLDKVISYAENSLTKNKSQDTQIRIQKFDNEYAKSGKKFLKTIDDLAGEIRGETGFAGFGKAKVPDAIGSDFREMAKDVYLNEGLEIDQAIDYAKNKILSEWKVTNIGKKRFAKHAPEAYYPEGKWIEDQAIQAVRKSTIEEMPNIKDEISLEVIPQTIDTGKPSYFIYRQPKGKPLDFARGSDNMPIIFTPNFEETEEHKSYQEFIKDLSPERVEKIEKGNQISRNRGKVDPLDIFSGGLY